MEIILILLMFFLISVVVLLFVMLFKNHNRITHKEVDKMRNQISEELIRFQNSVRQDLNLLNENTTNHLFTMNAQMNEQLQAGFTTTGKAFTKMMEQVTKIDRTQSHLVSLGDDISSLHKILNDKKTRGIYGEIELYTLLESAYGDNRHFFAKQYRLSNGYIVDAVIFGNDVLGMIPIDSKFPLENFNRLQNSELSKEQKNMFRNEFKNDVKKHIQTIASKYLIAGETSEFAYLFIPAEAVFSYINTELTEVIHYSYEKKVYLVSPTTLMAYITAIKTLYLEQKKNERIADIQKELIKLSVEFERFTKRYESVARDYEKTYHDMKDLMITASKLHKRFVQIEQVELEE